MELAQQGSYQIERDRNILVVDAHGPFSDETSKQYVAQMYKACDEFDGEPWGLLITFYGKSVFTPDMEQALIEMTKYRMERGMIANASVIINSSSADIQQMQLRRIYQSCNLTFHVFSDVVSAKRWLVNFVNEQSPKRA